MHSDEAEKGVPTTETCTVKQAGGVSGTITTNKLTGTSSETEHTGVATVEAGGEIAKFELRKEAPDSTCPFAAATVTATGDLTGTVPTTKRSHVTYNVTTAQNTFLLNLAAASFSATFKTYMTAAPETTVALETS